MRREHAVQLELFNKPPAPALLTSTDRMRAIELLKALLTEAISRNRAKDGATNQTQGAKDDEDLS